jgi:hypothetical protein
MSSIDMARFFALYPGWDFSKAESEKKPFHWYITSNSNWQTGSNLFEVLKKQEKRDKEDPYWDIETANLYMVPLPPEAPYKIKESVPDVEGLVFVATIEWPKRRTKRGGISEKK